MKLAGSCIMEPMTTRRTMLLLAVLVLVFGACSDVQRPTADDDAAIEEKRETDEDSGQAKTDDKQQEKSRGDRSKRPRSQKAASSSESEGDDGSGGEEAAEDDGSSRYAPSPGLYTYSQTGFEEFCDATSCEREDLPPRQKVQTYYEGTKGGSLIVVTEARSSQNRFTKTTALHSPQHAKITKVHVRINYEGFSFENTYRPDPPVESVRYPLRAGETWSGSWQDSTSGDYKVSVGQKQTVEAAGSTVQAFPVETTTTFRGEIQGRARVVVWIDPATAAVVKSEGSAELKSVFGRYNTTFATALREGPDYR